MGHGGEHDLEPAVGLDDEGLLGQRGDPVGRVVHAHLAGIRPDLEQWRVPAQTADAMGRLAVEQRVEIVGIGRDALVLQHAPDHRHELRMKRVGELEMVLEAHAQHAQQEAMALGQRLGIARRLRTPKHVSRALQRVAERVPERPGIGLGLAL